jgi:tRNA 2-thiouridine synthesizing protein B
VLLIEDGVYAAARDTAVSKRVQEALKSVSIYALKPDVEARGMQNRVMDGVRLVDYGGFVDLVAEHNAVQSWL